MQRTSKIAEDSGFIPAEACGLLDDVNLLYLASSTTPRRRNLQVALAQYMVTHFRSSSTKSLSWLLSSLICMVCGRELAAKVVVLSARCVLTRIVHEYMIATSAFSKMLMLHFSLHAEKLEVERERESSNLTKGMQEYWFVPKTHSQRNSGIHVLYQMQV